MVSSDEADRSVTTHDRPLPAGRIAIGAVIISAIVFFFSFQPTFDKGWQPVVRHAPWQERDGFTTLSFKDRMWVIGGGNKKNEALSDVWSSDNGIDWRIESNQTPWQTSYFSSGVVFRDHIWILGGWSSALETSNQVWASENGSDWKLMTNNAPWKARGGAAVVVFKDKLWMIGGSSNFRNQNNQSSFNDIWSSSDGVNWELVTKEAPWEPRAFHSVLAINGRIWLVGGGYWSSSARGFDDIWSSEDGITWRQEAKASLPGRRLWSSILTFHDKIWITGGLLTTEKMVSNDTWVGQNGDQWELYFAKERFSPRLASGTIVFKDRLWVLGGSNSDFFSDIWSLHPEKSSDTIRRKLLENMVRARTQMSKFFHHTWKQGILIGVPKVDGPTKVDDSLLK